MRNLKRNEIGFFYALLLSDADRVDQSGKRTGERTKTYDDPVFMKANISPATGYSNLEIFGKDTDYSKVICTTDLDCPITEESILWIYDGLEEDSTLPPYNFTVSKVAKSLNSILYAVRERKVDRRT